MEELIKAVQQVFAWGLVVSVMSVVFAGWVYGF